MSPFQVWCLDLLIEPRLPGTWVSLADAVLTAPLYFPYPAISLQRELGGMLFDNLAKWLPVCDTGEGEGH